MKLFEDDINDHILAMQRENNKLCIV